MPLLALLLLNAALGLAAAQLGARELRASPRAVLGSRGFAALALHEALVAAPALLYLLVRHADWMVSYAVDGARLPSALDLAIVTAHAGLALGGYALGARWLREHHGRRALAAAGGAAALALLGVLVLHGRVGAVGSYVQFRGGFGLHPFLGSPAAAAVAVLGVIQVAALAHLAWALRARG